ncbi:MAG: hypothetical protein U0894_14160 [Pirellulales bacterium]
MEKCSLNGSGNVKLTSAQLSGRHGKQQDTAIHKAFHFANLKIASVSRRLANRELSFTSALGGGDGRKNVHQPFGTIKRPVGRRPCY